MTEFSDRPPFGLIGTTDYRPIIIRQLCQALEEASGLTIEQFLPVIEATDAKQYIRELMEQKKQLCGVVDKGIDCGTIKLIWHRCKDCGGLVLSHIPVTQCDSCKEVNDGS